MPINKKYKAIQTIRTKMLALLSQSSANYNVATLELVHKSYLGRSRSARHIRTYIKTLWCKVFRKWLYKIIKSCRLHHIMLHSIINWRNTIRFSLDLPILYRCFQICETVSDWYPSIWRITFSTKAIYFHFNSLIHTAQLYFTYWAVDLSFIRSSWIRIPCYSASNYNYLKLNIYTTMHSYQLSKYHTMHD